VAALDAIVDRLSEEFGAVRSGPTALDGGITNRNYHVRFGRRDCVVRLAGKDTELLGISREAERLAGRRAAELSIGPAVLAAGPGFVVTEYLDGGPIDGKRLRAAPEAAATALRTFHDSGLELPVRFWVPDLLESYASLVVGRGGELPEPYHQAQELVARIAQALPLSEPVPCHDDLLPGNLLAAGAEPGRPLLVDWEYAGMGHRYFDLGNLAVNNDFDFGAEERLLEAYLGEPPTEGPRAALRLMRIVSDAREAAWGVVQGVISELEFDFGAYAEKHFARLRAAAGGSRLEEDIGAATA
jgi:thiamine kinase-like enzyme